MGSTWPAAGFQSLLSWNSPIFDARPLKNPRAASSVFQSLLSWIAALRHAAVFDQAGLNAILFQSCCRGSPSSTRGIKALQVIAPYGFQSLLSWIALFDLAEDAALRRFIQGFQLPIPSHLHLPLLDFNFVVVESPIFDSGGHRLFPSRTLGRRAGLAMFQSLLSWKSPIFDGWLSASGVVVLTPGFNPCCRGVALFD